MTPEEQAGFLGEWKADLRDAIRDQTARFERLSAEVKLLRAETQSALGVKLSGRSEALPAIPLNMEADPISGRLTTDLLLMLHRAACMDSGTRGTVGALRSVDVWIGRAGEDRKRALFTPPAADEVGLKLSKLLREWNSAYSDLCSRVEEEKIHAIARFYHAFLWLHPFIDGNGRVARILFSQQVLDLFGPRDSITLDQGVAYYSALQAADKGDLSLLNELVTRAVNM